MKVDPMPNDIPTLGSALRRKQDNTMIPAPVARMMLALVLLTLALVATSVWTGRERAGRPAVSEIVEMREITLVGRGAQAVLVLDENGDVLADMPHGGFITVIQNALERARTVAQADQTKPIRLVKYANGRFVAEDPTTGWSAELYAFGGDNEAKFEELMAR